MVGWHLNSTFIDILDLPETPPHQLRSSSKAFLLTYSLSTYYQLLLYFRYFQVAGLL